MTASPTTAGLSVREATVRLGEAPILRGVSLEVGIGEWVFVIGPNGAGKTTLLRAVAGAVPAGGSVLLDGHDLSRLPRRRLARLVAVVPQHPQVPEGMSVTDYVLLGRTPYIPYWGVEGAHDRRRAGATLERLGLAGLTGRPLSTLSGGERQRAVLARALAQDAAVLLLDEPTTGLDIGHQQQVLELVDELRRERALVVLGAMHDLTLAGQYADRLVFLDRGRVAAEGPPDRVLTPALLADRYQAEVEVLTSADGPVVVPRRRPG